MVSFMEFEEVASWCKLKRRHFILEKSMVESTRSKQNQETLQREIDVHQEAIQEIRGLFNQLTDMPRSLVANQNQNQN